MNETSKERGPEEVLIKETIENWKKELPESLHDWPIEKGGKLFSREDLFHDFDDSINKLKKNEYGEIEELALGLKQNKKQATNNFYLMFLPRAAKEALDGNVSDVYGSKPFYINARFNNAWNRMCEQFPNEVEQVIKYVVKKIGGDGFMSQEENASLSKLALHLSEKEGVVMPFLCK